MSTIIAKEARKGTYIVINQVPYEVVKFSVCKPGKGQPTCTLGVVSLLDNVKKELKLSPHKNLDVASIRKDLANYMYKDNNNLYFLDQSSYESISMPIKNFLNEVPWLKEGTSYNILYFNDLPIRIAIPNFINSTIIQTTPAGTTYKKAIITENITIDVPIFIKENNIITVDTRDLTYVSKAKSLES